MTPRTGGLDATVGDGPAVRRLRHPQHKESAPILVPVVRQVMAVSEAGALLGLGRSGSYDAVRRGEIPVIRLRRRLVVSVAQMEALLGLDGGTL